MAERVESTHREDESLGSLFPDEEEQDRYMSAVDSTLAGDPIQWDSIRTGPFSSFLDWEQFGDDVRLNGTIGQQLLVNFIKHQQDLTDDESETASSDSHMDIGADDTDEPQQAASTGHQLDTETGETRPTMIQALHRSCKRTFRNAWVCLAGVWSSVLQYFLRVKLMEEI